MTTLTVENFSPALLLANCKRQDAIQVKLPFNEVEIVNVSDVHIGEHGCDMKLFKKTIDYVMAEKNRYLTLNGDIINLATPRSPSSIYEQVNQTDTQFKLALKWLDPAKKRILFLTDGNHELRSNKEIGLTINMVFAAMLGVPYCGPSAVAHFKVGKIKKTKKTQGSDVAQHYLGFYHHTTGGGGYTKGAKINRVDLLNKIFPSADFYVGGHNHNRAYAEDMYKDYDRRTGKIIMRPRKYFSSAGFVKYTDSYAEYMQLPPAAMGPTVIILSGDKGLKSWDPMRVSFKYIS